MQTANTKVWVTDVRFDGQKRLLLEDSPFRKKRVLTFHLVDDHILVAALAMNILMASIGFQYGNSTTTKHGMANCFLKQVMWKDEEHTCEMMVVYVFVNGSSAIILDVGTVEDGISDVNDDSTVDG
ncbi:hypothetical protein Tco_0702314 [Tanacetum coccineum]|uniref:Uncharacterized protein n=1 Tax=Tanacetum coccineum TaxID=301880 RepID=A0ABQ4XX64_9ASTR